MTNSRKLSESNRGLRGISARLLTAVACLPTRNS
jgi:hypothetical protein